MTAPRAEPDRPLVVAHRGANRDAPENTLAAFRLAVTQGADLLELDLRQTRDGELVAIHDARLERTTNGSGLVCEMDYARLRRLDAGRWRGEQFAGLQVPSLEEVLEQTAGVVGLAVELKGRCPDMAARAVAQIQATDRRGDVILLSRHCQIIDQVQRLDPDIGVSCYRHDAHRWLEHLDPHGPPTSWHSDYLFASVGEVTPRLVRSIQQHGRKVVTELEAMDPPREAEVRRLAEMGVDSIVTDHVAEVAAILRQGGL